MAVSSVVIAVEGVLKKHVTNAPVPVGIALYHGLANTFNVLLVTDLDRKELDRWCALEGLNRHAAVEYNDGVISNWDIAFRRLQQVKNLRQKGYSIDLVIEPNPDAVIKLIYHGFTTMLYTHAEYALPQWRPDFEYKVKGWEEIEKHETKMAELRAMEALTEKEGRQT